MFSTDDLKIRVKQAGQRRTMGYSIHRKFELPQVKAELQKYGFEKGNYSKVIVTWGWTPEAKKVADQAKIEVWDFRDLLQEIASASKEHRTYFTDDMARTIQLFAKSLDARRPD